MNMSEIFDPTYKRELIERLKQRKAAGKLPDKYQLDPNTGKKVRITSDQRIREAERGTPIGNEELFAEYEFMEELKRRGGIK